MHERLSHVERHWWRQPRLGRESGITLIELLVAMVIGSIVSGLLVLGWISLSQAYSHTTSSSESRDDARQAVARLSREIRDAEATGGLSAVTSASDRIIEFTTTFNIEGNTGPSPTPVLTQYEYRIDPGTGEQTLHRLRNFIGVAPPWERDDLVISHLVNYAKSGELRVPPFQYGWMDADRMIKFTTPRPPGSIIKMVRIHLLVDQNDGRAPVAMDLQATVQLRNQPQY